MLVPMKRASANTATPARSAKVASRRLKLRKSRWPPRVFGNSSGLSSRNGSWSSASSAIAWSGTARLLSRVLVCLTRPFAYAPSNLDDAGGTIDVALLEREQLGGPESGRGRETDHRPEHRPQPLGHRADLLPGIE